MPVVKPTRCYLCDRPLKPYIFGRPRKSCNAACRNKAWRCGIHKHKVPVGHQSAAP